jgi:hypothetical protein
MRSRDVKCFGRKADLNMKIGATYPQETSMSDEEEKKRICFDLYNMT